MQDECLVICKDDGVYYVATRQLMTQSDAEEYVKRCDPGREPIIVHPNRNWQLRSASIAAAWRATLGL